VVAAGATSSQNPSYAMPTELAAARPAQTGVFGLLAIAELLGIILVPGMVTIALRRRRASGGAA
jgi:hypothetical protein